MPLRIDTPNGQYLLSATPNAPLRLPAADGQYLLADTASGLAPESVVVTRIGNDLHIILPDSDIARLDLILENYYPADGKNLVGLDGSGQRLPYLPESAQTADSVHLLAESMVAVQSLHGAFAPVAPAINPFAPLAGIAGLALAGALWADDRKGGRTPSPPEQPQTPFVPDQPEARPPAPDNHLPPSGNLPQSPGTTNHPATLTISGIAKVGQTLSAHLKDDDGSGRVEDAPSPIADQHLAPDSNDVLVSPNVNPDELAKLLAVPYDEVIEHVDRHGHNLLQNVTPTPISPTLRGGGGDDILISGYGQDYLEGGAGKDLFVYIMDGQNSFPYHSNDVILDFNPAEDRIVLTRGDGWNLQFDRVEFVPDNHVQRLHFKVFKGTESYINAVHIKSHDGHYLGVDEVLNAIIIL